MLAVHCLLSSVGSAETQRGEDAVSGSRMPTFVFAATELPAELPLLQPASPATSAAAPAIATTIRGLFASVRPS
jgi:hypothetical protein